MTENERAVIDAARAAAAVLVSPSGEIMFNYDPEANALVDAVAALDASAWPRAAEIDSFDYMSDGSVVHTLTTIVDGVVTSTRRVTVAEDDPDESVT